MKIDKFPHVATIVGVIVLGLTLIGQRVFLKKSFPDQPLKIVLEKNISLESIVANDDAVVAKLKKGDKKAPKKRKMQLYQMEKKMGQKKRIYMH